MGLPWHKQLAFCFAAMIVLGWRRSLSIEIGGTNTSSGRGSCCCLRIVGRLLRLPIRLASAGLRFGAGSSGLPRTVLAAFCRIARDRLARPPPALDLPFHADLKLMAECCRKFLFQPDPATAPAWRLPFHRRSADRHQKLHRGTQPVIPNPSDGPNQRTRSSKKPIG